MNIKYHCQAGGETGYHAHSKAFWSRLEKFNDNQGVPMNIVLDTSDHPWFYRDYEGIKICYNVYESTLQPERFFNHILKNWDYFWCPSTWQRDCTIAQGFPADRVMVVPEGVDGNEFFPVADEELAKEFTFVLIGKYEYRKATEEMISCWLETFPLDLYPTVKLILSVDNMFDRANVENKLRLIEEKNDPRIKIVHFPPRAEYIKLLQTSHCFLSCSRSEGWNLPLIEAIACGIPTISSNNSAQIDFAKNISFMVDTKHLINPIPTGFPGDYYEPDFEQFKYGMRDIYNGWKEWRERALRGSSFVRQQFSWEKAIEKAVLCLREIEKRAAIEKPKTSSITDTINVTFIDGAKFEITGNRGIKYEVKFTDRDTNNVIYKTILQPDGTSWASPTPKYYVNWKIEASTIVEKVEESGTAGEDTIILKKSENVTHEIFSQEMNLKDQRIYINLESKAIGDTLSWMPYVEEFRKKHNCHVILTTFLNDILSDQYPEIEFVKPGTVAHNLYAQYKVGCFDNDSARNKNNWRGIPLQKVAADILGLQYKEIRPKITVRQNFVTPGRKYVCISEHSTMHSKYWTYPGGWQEIVDYLGDIGYDVISVSKNVTSLAKVIPVDNTTMDETISIINNCEFFVGVGSGLSWIAWGLGKKVVMISGFSDPFTEFRSDNYRLASPPGKCHGCFNDAKIKFERSWYWCPRNKDYECSKSITPEMVKEKINLLISHL